MINKEMLSNPNSSTLGTDLDQNTTTNVTGISSAFNTGNLSIEDGVNNNDLGVPIGHSFATTSFETNLVGNATTVNLDQIKNSDNVSESLVLKDEADNPSNGNLNHPRCNSQSLNPDGDVTSLPKKVLKKHHTISTTSIIKHKILCCKIFTIFAVVSIENLITNKSIAVEDLDYHDSRDTIPNNLNVDTNTAVDESINNVSITKLENSDNAHGHKMCRISQDENTEDNVGKIIKVSLNITLCQCCKLLTAFAISFVIGCFLIPTVLYHVSRTNASAEIPEDPAEYSINKNISNAKVCKRRVTS